VLLYWRCQRRGAHLLDRPDADLGAASEDAIAPYSAAGNSVRGVTIVTMASALSSINSGSWPLIDLAASEARNTASAAMSFGSMTARPLPELVERAWGRDDVAVGFHQREVHRQGLGGIRRTCAYSTDCPRTTRVDLEGMG
jgi:hypothetical protein